MLHHRRRWLSHSWLYEWAAVGLWGGSGGDASPHHLSIASLTCLLVPYQLLRRLWDHCFNLVAYLGKWFSLRPARASQGSIAAAAAGSVTRGCISVRWFYGTAGRVTPYVRYTSRLTHPLSS